MEEIHETHFYHEDTLPAPVTSPLIYGKDVLHLNLQSTDDHRRLEQLRRNNIQAEMNSPDFNFLKLASPDLERMLLAFQSSTSDNSPVGSTVAMIPSNTMNATEQIVNSKGLAEALQDLHDTQDIQGTQVNIVPQLSHHSTTADYVESASDQFYLTRDASGAITVTSNKDRYHDTSVAGSFAPVATMPGNEKPTTYVVQQYPSNAFLANTAPAQMYTTPLMQPVEELDTAAQIRALSAYNNVLAAQNSVFPSQVFKLDNSGSMFADSTTLEPIDLEVQELVKRERKKQRNRVASSKCRKRKLEKEAVLEVTVKEMKARNDELSAMANTLKQQICDLKQRVMDHVTEGCPITLQHLDDPSTLYEEKYEWSMISEQT